MVHARRFNGRSPDLGKPAWSWDSAVLGATGVTAERYLSFQLSSAFAFRRRSVRSHLTRSANKSRGRTNDLQNAQLRDHRRARAERTPPA